MTSKESNSADEHWLTSENTADWLETAHERVYFRNERVASHPLASTGELVKAGAVLTEALPGEYTVIITGGIARGYDMKYLADSDTNRINLDVYFLRPGFDHFVDLINEAKSDLDGTFTGETEVSD